MWRKEKGWGGSGEVIYRAARMEGWRDTWIFGLVGAWCGSWVWNPR